MTDVVWTFHQTVGSTAVFNAQKLVEMTGATWYCDSALDYVDTIDRLLVVAGGAAFAGEENLEAIARAVREARRVVWVVDDYKASIPKITSAAGSPYRASFRERHEMGGKEPVVVWSTVRELASRPGNEYVNLNSLKFDPYLSPKFSEREQSAIYYGYYRSGRADYFHRYFAKPKCPITLSYPTRGKSFDILGSYRDPLIRHVGKLENLLVDLSRHCVGLYLGDERSHQDYHSPAARFYEMLSAGLTIALQPEFVKTLTIAGYKVRDADIAKDSDELAESVRIAEDLHGDQHRRWFDVANGECAETQLKITDLWRKL